MKIVRETKIFQGLVLRSFPYGDSDLILKIITDTSGKVGVIARRARESRKRTGVGTPDLFDQGTIQVTVSSGSLLTLKEFTLNESFRPKCDYIDGVTCASVLAETADSLIPENTDCGDSPFRILKLSLEALSEATSRKTALRATFMGIANLLIDSGFLPEQSKPSPTSNGLRELLDLVERATEKKLVTKSSVAQMLELLKGA